MRRASVSTAWVLCLGLALALGLVGCSAKAPAPEAASASDPKPGSPEMEELVRREAASVELQELSGPGGLFRAEVPARLTAPIDAVDTTYMAELDMGTESPAICWLYPEGLDLASSLETMADAFLSNQSEVGNVQVRKVSAVGAGSFDGNPYVTVSWLYRALEAGGPSVGELKLYSAAKAGHAIACLHDEIGYRATFRRVVESLISSVEFQGEGPGAYYEEVHVMRHRGQNIGVQRVAFTRVERGNTRIDRTVSLVFPDGADVITSDTYETQVSTEKGKLLEQWSQTVEDGELASELFLSGALPDLWIVKGFYNDEQIEGTIERTVLPSELGQMRVLRTALEAGKEDVKLRYPVWRASAQPANLIEAETHVLERAGDDQFRVRRTVGSLTLDGIVDDRAALKTATITLGKRELELRQLFQRGDF